MPEGPRRGPKTFNTLLEMLLALGKVYPNLSTHDFQYSIRDAAAEG